MHSPQSARVWAAGRLAVGGALALLAVIATPGTRAAPEPSPVTVIAPLQDDTPSRPSSPPPHPSPPSSATELYEAGQKAISANRSSEAVRLLTEASKGLPDNIEFYYWLGVASWNRELGERSANAYERAIALDPEGESSWSLYALENVAEVYTRTDRARQARQAHRTALKRETRPEWIERIHDQIAELDLALGEYVPDEHTVHNEAGEIIGGVGPGQMHTNRNFEIARQTNDPIKEAEYYQKAIETDPEMYQPYFNLGLAYTHLGRYREAISWFEASDRIWKADSYSNPGGKDKTDAHAFLTLCHLELGDVETAASHAAIALANGDSDYFAMLYAQRVKIARGDAADAVPVLQAYAGSFPEHAETLHALALAYRALGSEAEYRETLRRAIEVIPDEHPWQTHLREKWRREFDRDEQ